MINKMSEDYLQGFRDAYIMGPTAALAELHRLEAMRRGPFIEILEPTERDICKKPDYCECAKCWQEMKTRESRAIEKAMERKE